MKKIILFIAIFHMISTNTFGQQREIKNQKCMEYPTDNANLNSVIVKIFEENQNDINKNIELLKSYGERERNVIIDQIMSGDTSFYVGLHPQAAQNLSETLTSLGNYINQASSIIQAENPNLSSQEVKTKLQNILKCYVKKNNNITFGDGFNNELIKEDFSCSSERLECIGEAAADAILGHVGCTALDVGFFTGLACHGYVVWKQIRTGKKCNVEYRKCMGWE
jgi:hypothetical protein